MTHSLRSVLVLLLLSSTAVSASAQGKEKDKGDTPYLLTLDKAAGTYQYEEVIPFDSAKISKEKAYKNAKQYILSSLKTGDNNIVNDDKDFSQLINNGNLVLKPTHGFGWAINTATVDFKLKMFFKDGRYKMVVDNVVYHAVLVTGSTIQPVVQDYSQLRNNKASRKFKDAIDEALVAFISGMKQAIVSTSSEATNSNW